MPAYGQTQTAELLPHLCSCAPCGREHTCSQRALDTVARRRLQPYKETSLVILSESSSSGSAAAPLPMFVPSLSWQNDNFKYKNRATDAFCAPARRALLPESSSTLLSARCSNRSALSTVKSSKNRSSCRKTAGASGGKGSLFCERRTQRVLCRH